MGETCFARLACGHAHICLAGLTGVSFSPLVPLTGCRGAAAIFNTRYYIIVIAPLKQDFQNLRNCINERSNPLMCTCATIMPKMLSFFNLDQSHSLYFCISMPFKTCGFVYIMATLCPLQGLLSLFILFCIHLCPL